MNISKCNAQMYIVQKYNFYNFLLRKKRRSTYKIESLSPGPSKAPDCILESILEPSQLQNISKHIFKANKLQ